MRSVGLKTLKNKLSEYVRLAAGGETVLRLRIHVGWLKRQNDRCQRGDEEQA
jgi:hypothetical protein